jgi:hypothetical protein
MQKNKVFDANEEKCKARPKKMIKGMFNIVDGTDVALYF